MHWKTAIFASGAMMFCAAAVGAADLPAPIGDDAYAPVDPASAQLGHFLFYDPILSGNRNTSCASCHHPKFGTGDGVSLSVGEGGIGLGPDRQSDPDNPPEQLIPRNAPALFNLGAREFTVLFHDGRIEADSSRPSGLRTPLEEEMVTGFANILSAQTMFPVLSQDEMAGHYSENEIAQAARQGRITGPDGAWDRIAQRVAAVPDYAAGFAALLPEVAAGRDITFADISNVIADFMALEWRSDTSPFDAHLREEVPLTGAAAQGMALFYGEAGCGTCHSGPFQTDHGFHVMAVPQFGPGKAARFESHSRDDGRMRVTGRTQDQFAFRTPSLRNVARTGPYGHTGSHRDLRAFVAYHADPAAGLAGYDPKAQAIIPVTIGEPFATLADIGQREALAGAVTVPPVPLTGADIDALVAFLESLSDPVALAGRLGVPERVPSGLPVER